MAYLLQRLLTEAAAWQPQRPAVASDGCLLTYQELDRLSNKVARALLRLGVAPGDRVAILAPKSAAAVVGLYGIRVYTVASRTREIGIRMALGASSADTQRMILREGSNVTAIGLGCGLLLALAIGRVLTGFLYDVHPVDAAVLSIAMLLLTVVSVLACYLPARKAARVDPMVALRYE